MNNRPISDTPEDFLPRSMARDLVGVSLGSYWLLSNDKPHIANDRLSIHVYA